MTLQPLLARKAETLDVPPAIPAIFRRAVERYGEQDFIIDGDRRMTFADVDRVSGQMARGLIALGLGKSARVGLLMPNCSDWVLNWLAASRMGALVVCLSSLYQPREIDYGLKHNDVDTLLISSRYLTHDYLDRLEKALPGLVEQRSPDLCLESHPYLRRIVVWGDCDRAWALRGPDDLFAAAEARPGMTEAFLANVEAQVTPADDLLIVCTSGTTANPKSVLHTHGSLIRSQWTNTPLVDIRRGDRVYNGMPFFWVGGFQRALMPALFEGATLVFCDQADTAAVVDTLLNERVSFINATVDACRVFRREIIRRGADASFIREGFDPPKDDNGQIIPQARRTGGPLGMTETFGTHSGETKSEPAPPGKEGNCGRPMPNIERRIVDPETGAVLGPGEKGELWVRGTTLMRGYYKRERHEVFTPDGFFRTGDLCVIDGDDYLFFHARLGEMIKTGGANVAPREVEVVLAAMPGVREAIVFGVPDPRRGEAVVAVVTPTVGATLDPEELRQKVRGELSAYKAPSLVVVMEDRDIPRTDSAKPKKHELRERIIRQVAEGAAPAG